MLKPMTSCRPGQGNGHTRRRLAELHNRMLRELFDEDDGFLDMLFAHIRYRSPAMRRRLVTILNGQHLPAGGG